MEAGAAVEAARIFGSPKITKKRIEINWTMLDQNDERTTVRKNTG